MEALLLIFIALSLGAFGQFFLKIGMDEIGKVSVLQIVKEKFLEVATQRFVALGILLYVISVGIWLAVLSRTELSFAYPLIGLSYVIVAVLSAVFLHENLTAFRIFGIALIVAGVFFVVRLG